MANYPYNVGAQPPQSESHERRRLLDLIGYNLGDYLPLLKKNTVLDIAYTLEYNRFGSKTSIQGKLRDIRLAT